MISINCPGCGKDYKLARTAAGKSATCKKCNTRFVIPATDQSDSKPLNPESAKSVADNGNKIVISFDDKPKTIIRATQFATILQPVISPATAPVGGGSMRLRRLKSDEESMLRCFSDFPLIRILTATGSPAEYYQIEYNIKGLVRDQRGGVMIKDQHLVEIQLTRDYPRQSPKCKMLTPVFHPNIEPTAICVGDHWTAQERLANLVVRIGEIISYQAFNIKSPLDGEAAMWADQNRHQLPVDSRDLMPPEM